MKQLLMPLTSITIGTAIILSEYRGFLKTYPHIVQIVLGIFLLRYGIIDLYQLFRPNLDPATISIKRLTISIFCTLYGFSILLTQFNIPHPPIFVFQTAFGSLFIAYGTAKLLQLFDKNKNGNPT